MNGADPRRPSSDELTCLVASFIADDPAAAGASQAELIRAIALTWPSLSGQEIHRAFAISGALREARVSGAQDQRQKLIEKTRLLHGAWAAAQLVHKYGLPPAS